MTITDVVIDASGREERGRNTLHADGVGLAYEHGYTVTTTWLSARGLEATVTRNAQLEGRVTYEASADGQTLRLSTAEQMSVFDRS